MVAYPPAVQKAAPLACFPPLWDWQDTDAKKQSSFAPTLLSQNLANVCSMVLRRVIATAGAALRWNARPPKVAFVMRLRPVRLPV